MNYLRSKEQVFKFKQFEVNHSKCAMKVGTDGVLLACTIPKYQRAKILDIGSGSGVIALILLQNNPEAEIHAVELDMDAYNQSIENFKASPWSNRIVAHHSSIQDFALESNFTFDIIVCNPPFFQITENLTEGTRKTARQEVHLNFNDLALSVNKLMHYNGNFYCIIQTSRNDEMQKIFENQQIYLHKIIRIQGKKHLQAKRSILQFSKTFKKSIEEDNIIIYKDNGDFTEQYKDITKDFYLKF